MNDKSLFYYGHAYHRFIDPTLTETHHLAVSLVPEASRVLDIACGTGTFALMLKKQKNCQVHGIDLSSRMIKFAQEHNPYPEITFQRKDATDLSDYTAASFDVATIQMFFHEINQAQQDEVFNEALRVAKKVIIIDYRSPLSRNISGMIMRLTEITIGRDHYPNFKAFLANNGIQGIFHRTSMPVQTEHHSIFSQNCREVFLVAS
jgi:ubiquinone/menaquinone biosynthesis C-methylase UbiE